MAHDQHLPVVDTYRNLLIAPPLGKDIRPKDVSFKAIAVLALADALGARCDGRVGRRSVRLVVYTPRCFTLRR
jgi:hypothetical protein